MIQDSISTIFPENIIDRSIAAIAIVIIVLSCFLVIYAPGVTSKLFVMIIGLSLCIIFRIHVVQLIILLVTITAALPSEYDGMIVQFTGILMLLILFYLAASILLRQTRLRHSYFNDAIAAIYVAFAINGIISGQFNSMLDQAAFGEIFRSIMYAFLAIATYHLFENISFAHKIMWILLSISIALAIYSYYLAASLGIASFMLYGVTILHGASGALANASGTSAMVTNGIPLVYAYVIYGQDKKIKMFSIILAIFLTIIWLLLNCRADYVFLFFAFLFLLGLHKNGLNYLTAILIAVGVAFLLVNTIPLFRLALRLNAGMTYRGDLWSAAVRMINESPVLGKGFGFFDRFRFQYVDPGVGRIVIGSTGAISPHNMLLQKAVDLGIGASVALLFTWLLPIFYIVKNVKLLRQSQHFYLFAAFGAILVGSEVRDMFETGGTVLMIVLTAMIFKMPDLMKSDQFQSINDRQL